MDWSPKKVEFFSGISMAPSNVAIQHSEKTPLVTLLCSTTARGNVVKEVCRRPKQQQQQPKAGQQEHSMLHNARVVAEKNSRFITLKIQGRKRTKEQINLLRVSRRRRSRKARSLKA